MTRYAFGLLVLGLSVSSGYADKRPIAVADLFAFQRVADPQISPDGKLVVYQVSSVDLGANKSTTNLWLADVSRKSPPRRLTSSTKADRHPRWSPDGTQILFESTRSGENQLWVIDLAGGEARQLTTISTGASNAIWSPDGKSIAFVSAVFPEYSDKPFKEADAANKKRLDEAEKGPVKARVFTRLFYRHWDEYVEDKRQHLFVIPAEGGEPKDITPGDRDANPTSTTFSVGDDFTFSPDGKHVIFTAVPDRDEAWSTDYDICRVPVAGGGKPAPLTKANRAADNAPRFSPDGKRLAWRAQKRAGYEADKWDILVADYLADGPLGEPKNLTGGKDVSVNEFVWLADGKTLLFTADENGSSPIWETNLAGGEIRKFSEGGQNT
ncbi:MAG TPA: S9 family peptidase, partial [Gemmataceae bacterium]|nr:S9 family peptidase [Gemmataceae bacterium]